MTTGMKEKEEDNANLTPGNTIGDLKIQQSSLQSYSE